MTSSKLPTRPGEQAVDSNSLSTSTLAIHADDFLNSDDTTDVAPALHVSTTYRYTRDVERLAPLYDEDVRTAKVLFILLFCGFLEL
jgi:hypothetical protein